MDCSLSGYSVHGIFQEKVLEWIAISFSRGSSRPRNRTHVSHTAGRCFTIWATPGSSTSHEEDENLNPWGIESAGASVFILLFWLSHTGSLQCEVAKAGMYGKWGITALPVGRQGLISVGIGPNRKQTDPKSTATEAWFQYPSWTTALDAAMQLSTFLPRKLHPPHNATYMQRNPTPGRGSSWQSSFLLWA